MKITSYYIYCSRIFCFSPKKKLLAICPSHVPTHDQLIIYLTRPRWWTGSCVYVYGVSHSLVSNSCDPMDCSPPGSSVHGILQARILEWRAIPFSRGVFLTQGSNSGLLRCRQILYYLSHQGRWEVSFSFSTSSEEEAREKGNQECKWVSQPTVSGSAGEEKQ